ncbi:MAG: response regulator transcription factor [Bacteroidetes bacterium]|nr:response regulator transcription factor [Bacteroidota bacterium]
MNRVLLFDNDADVLDVMQEALTCEGFDVRCIEKSDNIFPEIECYNPGLIILDHILDGVTGGEICQQIKENRKTSALPVVVVSAYPGTLPALEDCGCDAFIPKPFGIDDLTGRIRELINNKLNK